MKIEMGESLFYSWLRHVKECQIVQTNWKASPQWPFQHEDEIKALMTAADTLFNDKYNYTIFKKNSSLTQIMRQGECDAVGISVQEARNHYFAVDVAFHENGLNYGTREETIMKVIAKSLRSAMCLYGYMNAKNVEIIFASPKINPSIMNDLLPCIEDVNALLISHNFDSKLRVIANDAFNDYVLQPILLMSDGISDTSELFLRSYQMYMMFAVGSTLKEEASTRIVRNATQAEKPVMAVDEGAYKELKIGQLACTVLRRILATGLVREDEIALMEKSDYSKRVFDLQYPILLRTDAQKREQHYYKEPVIIHGKKYRICSEWYEKTANNDRPYLLQWIENHTSAHDAPSI